MNVDFARILPRPMLIASLIIVSSVALFYVALSVPYFDDICRANSGTSLSEIYARLVEYYLTWTGRWSAMALHHILNTQIRDNAVLYSAALLVGIALLWVGFYGLLDLVFENISTAQKRAGATILLIAAWAGSPSVGETWNWLTGLIENLLPLSAAVWCLLALRASLSGSTARRALHLLSAVTAALLLTGLHEVQSVVVVTVLAVVVIYRAILRGERDLQTLGPILIVIAVLVAGIAFSYVAPGNAVRRQVFPNSGDFVFSFRLSFIDPDTSPIVWLFDPRLWAMSLAALTSAWLAPLAPKWASDPPPILASPWIRTGLIAAAAMLAALLCHFLVTLVMGFPAPERAKTGAYFVFLAGWLATLASLAPYARPHPTANAVATIVFALSLLLSNNTLRGVVDAYRTATIMRPAYEERSAIARKAMSENKQTLVLAPLKSQTKHSPWNDMTDDPAYWINDCFEKLYKIPDVRVLAPAGKAGR